MLHLSTNRQCTIGCLALVDRTMTKREKGKEKEIRN